MVIALNKPRGIASAGMICEPPGLDQGPLAEAARPAGELAPDAEGLILWTDEPKLRPLLAQASSRCPHVYWAQVAHIPSEATLERLQRGILLDHQKTSPFRAWVLPVDPDVPLLPGKAPNRAGLPWCWISLSVIRETDRQIRKVLSAIGHPACRLIRVQIGTLTLGDLPSSRSRKLSPAERAHLVGDDAALPSPWRYHRLRRNAPGAPAQ